MMKPLKYLVQYACFECRKGFKRYVSYLPENEPQPEPTCLECGRKMWEMGRAFKAPKQDDVKQWRKVEALVRNGITFHSYGSHGLGKYPSLLKEVEPFIEKVQRRSEGEGKKLLRKISKKGTKQKVRRSL